MANDRVMRVPIRALGRELRRLGEISHAAIVTPHRIGRNTICRSPRFATPAFVLGMATMLVVSAGAEEPHTASRMQAQTRTENQEKSGGLFSISTGKQRRELVESLPLERLTNGAQKRILRIADSPTLYRRLPVASIACDSDMFLFLTRNPEVLVGMWELMGVTNVNIQRTNQYQLDADDGSGTTCQVDLVYGDSKTHIFVAEGSYEGRLTTRPIRGSGVFVLRSKYAQNSSGGTTVTGVLDCFIKFDSFGADLVARTLGGLIGRSADNNYVETSRFVAQVSQASETNPAGMVDVARQLPQVQEPTREKFVQTILMVAKRSIASSSENEKPVSNQNSPRSEPPNLAPRTVRTSRSGPTARISRTARGANRSVDPGISLPR